MVENLTDHERYLMEKMTPRHRVLIPQLSPQERQSLSKNIKTAEDLDRIQTDIGSDAEIEKMLFGDSGGKFDDPEWGKLEPLDDNTRKLYEEAALRLDRLNTEAVACQRRSDLTLRARLGWALARETGYTTLVQSDAQTGTHYIQGPDTSVYVLPPDQSTWDTLR